MKTKNGMVSARLINAFAFLWAALRFPSKKILADAGSLYQLP